jgi:hypothetical protein
VNFGTKKFEICEAFTDYLWNFNVYTGAECDITISINTSDKLQSSKIVVRFAEPLCGWIIFTIHHLCVGYLHTVGPML